QSSRGVSGSRRSVARRALSTIQVAIAVIVLIAAGLLIRSFSYLSNLEPGVDTTNVITANFALLDARYLSPRNAYRYFNEVLTRLQQLPGVEASAVAHNLPYERGWNTAFNKRDDSPNGSARLTNYAYISPQFFQALRIPILKGRAIADSDQPGSPPVAV